MLSVSVTLALHSEQVVVEIELPEGATVADALAAVRPHPAFTGLDLSAYRVGVWSRPCGLQRRLRSGDRVELYRPLAADAKTMRRARAKLKPSTRSRSGP